MHTRHLEFFPARVSKTLTIPETTIYDNLVMTAKKYPEKIAIEYYGGSYTYEQVLKEVEHLAGYLERTLKVKQEENVLLLMQNSPQFLIGFYAILRIRAVVVPINPMSTTDDLAFFVKDCGIKTALVGAELYDKIASLRETQQLAQLLIASYGDYADATKSIGTLPPETKRSHKEGAFGVTWKEAMAKEEHPAHYEGKSGDVAVIPYTSGTTGLPKGCVHTNKTVQANIVGAYHWMNVTADAVSLTSLPLFHVTGLVHSALSPIYAGSTIVLLTRWDRAYAAQAVERYHCSHWINISTMLIDFLANPKLSEVDISSLQIVGGGGAPLPEAVGKQLFERTGLHYVEGYGLSETMSHTHFNPPDRPKLQCLGIPSFGMDARILSPGTDEELDVGEEGELVVNGPQVFTGYYHREDENAASHIEIQGKRFFRTGDIVRMDEEGYFFMVDRLKRMINAAGYKVWPTEVETILYKHPAVQQACVVRFPDEKRGETVKALIILHDEFKGKTTKSELIDWSKQQMAAYKHPRIIEFRDKFPTTMSGKILWRELQE
ncbi:MAG TPA: long-chain-fatty-acid--CoA ligase [Virgibacillus sp.]|nr:long-chain-fatty-acid--CoA ligase [Virgibacillus sp.]